LWAYPLEQMSSQWIRDRVAVPEVEQVLRSVCLDESSTAWGPNATFCYPRRRGIGAVWRAVANTLPADRIQFGERVVRINAERKFVWTACGRRYTYDHLISTMPLDQLLRMLGNGQRAQTASGLARTSTHVVGIGVNGECPRMLESKLWIYYPDNSVPFYRVTVVSNLSPENTPRPEKTWSLMAEVSESPFRRLSKGNLIGQVIQGLQSVGVLRASDTIISQWHREVSHGYPVPTLGRDRILAETLSQLQTHGSYSRGRFGAWKYEVGNQDHSFMQGVEAVEHIVHGHCELTLENPDLVNSRHSVFPYPEWSPG
jgi:protoporphyrinogen oxidase